MAYRADAAAMKSAASSVSVTCDHPTEYNVSLSAGVARVDAAIIQKMADPASALLGRAMLPGFAHTVNGNRTLGTNTLAETANGYSQARAFYSQTAWAQCLKPGAHADTITITVTY
jgi:spore coat protein U-like protein